MQPERPSICVVIPSLRGDTRQLEQALASQTWQPDEVQVVRGVRPNGRARNLGVASTHSDILVFIDDDALPATRDLIEWLARPLLADRSIGVTGAARRLPAEASWFQRRVSAEIPRMVNPVPDELLETNPPLEGYGHSLITTTCCAVPRQVFQAAGGFREDLTSGVDSDFFHRVRRLGYRFMMVPRTHVEHLSPADLSALLRKFYWYGQGYGQETQRRPEQGMGIPLPTAVHRLAFLAAATLWVLPNVLILYSYGYPRWELGFRPLKALSTYAVAWGYAAAWRDRARQVGGDSADQRTANAAMVDANERP